MTAPVDCRPSPLAGRWYPRDPDSLAHSIDTYLDAAQPPPVAERVVGLLAPHAGHRFSGPVAAHAFKLVRGLAVDVVAIIGPSHYPYEAQIVVTGHDAYQTPLGTVPVTREALNALAADVSLHAVYEDPEHALEIELPFLQRVLSEPFRILPLALIDQSLAQAQALGTALAQVLHGQRALLVASSDLSHFYPQDTAHELDQHVLDRVQAFDAAGVIAANDQGTGLACGHGALAAVMIAAQQLGADQAVLVGYATSGDVTLEYQKVVGYGAAVFTQTARA